MWVWFLILMIPVIILAFFEELIEFFVNRYAQGPAAWEGKTKEFLKRKFAQLKTKLKRAPVTEKE